MDKFYIFLKYFFIIIWTVFVVAPFLWALTTSFKDFQSVNAGVTYIPCAMRKCSSVCCLEGFTFPACRIRIFRLNSECH